MKNNRPLKAQLAFWGISLVVIAWIIVTMWFEIHRGLPVNGAAWFKRLIGWGVEVWLVRALILGMRRYGPTLGS